MEYIMEGQRKGTQQHKQTKQKKKYTLFHLGFVEIISSQRCHQKSLSSQLVGKY